MVVEIGSTSSIGVYKYYNIYYDNSTTAIVVNNYYYNNNYK
jgi:hypothetical protein